MVGPVRKKCARSGLSIGVECRIRSARSTSPTGTWPPQATTSAGSWPGSPHFGASSSWRCSPPPRAVPSPSTAGRCSPNRAAATNEAFFTVDYLACIIQPGAPRFEKMQVERYVVVLLLSAGHASASPVVDQRWDLHLLWVDWERFADWGRHAPPVR